MKCVCCDLDKELAQSHVISDFIRKAITGIEVGSGRRFEFSYINRRDLPRQNLPKPRLLCKDWDNKFGSQIEKGAKEILLPAGDYSSPESWNQLHLDYFEVKAERDEALLCAARYVNLDEQQDFLLRKFSVLTAWRALHAMHQEGNEAVAAFMNSPEGISFNSETIEYLKFGGEGEDLLFPYHHDLYFLGPKFAYQISGAMDEVPFAWTFLDKSKNYGVAVMLGYWVVVLSVLKDGHRSRSFRGLIDETFAAWAPWVGSSLREARNKNA